MVGWEKSALYSSYPLNYKTTSLKNEIKIKVNKDFLFDDLKISYEAGPDKSNINVNYQENKNVYIFGDYDHSVRESYIHYSSWIAVLFQYIFLIASGVALSYFLSKNLEKLFEKSEESLFYKFVEIFNFYVPNLLILLVGLYAFYATSDLLIDGTSLSLFSATMTANDVAIFAILGFFLSLGVRTLKNSDNKNIKILNWFVFFINPLVSFLILESAYNPDLMSMEPVYILINAFILLLFQLLIFFIFRRKKPAMITVLLISIVFGVANDALMILRDSPLIPAFLGSLGVATDIASNTVINFDGIAVSTIAVAVVWLLIIISIKDTKIKIARKKYFISLGAFSSALLVTVIVSANFFLSQRSVGVNLWRPSRTYFVEGAPYSFYRISIKQLITAPEGYDKEKVEDILKSYYYGDGSEDYSENASLSNPSTRSNSKEVAKLGDDKKSSSSTNKNSTSKEVSKLDENTTSTNSEKTEKKPNIIMIQSEAMADYYGLGNLKMNKNPLEFTRGLTKNTVQGFTYVSVLGGGTVNSEFEALTGLPLSFYPMGSYPFQQFVKEGHTSVGRVLQNQGYDTFITHPNKPTNYSRQEVWPNLGFDNIAFKDDYLNSGDYSFVRDFISDESLYNKIISQYENKTSDNPLFTYSVSMQNHGSYTGSYTGGDIKILNSGVTDAGADEYLNLVNLTDNDFKKLVSYFEDYDEPTIICIFGDHQPGSYDTYLDLAYGEGNYGEMDYYKTPLTIWANYDIEEEQDVNISMNYLSAYLFKKAGGVELSAYEKYLMNMVEKYPIITTRIARDSMGNDVLENNSFQKKNTELNSLVYYEVKSSDPEDVYFNYPAMTQD